MSRDHTHCRLCSVVTWRVESGICRSCIAMRRIDGEKPVEIGDLVWQESANDNESPKMVRRKAS